MLRTAGLFATLALVVSACSQAPADVAAPTLGAQFGTADDDYGADVVTAPAGGAYALSGQSGDLENGLYNKILLRRFDTSGKALWSREVSNYSCDYDRDYECGNEVRFAVTLHTDARGNAYALDGFRYIVGDEAFQQDYNITKVDSSGKIVKRFRVGATGTNFADAEDEQDFLSVAVDKDGNVYVAKAQFDFSFDSEKTTRTNVVAKYSTSGSLLWQRPSTVGIPKAVAVSSTGNVFVVGSTGLSKYAPSGNLLWTKTGAGEDVTISGFYVYVRQGGTLRKYDGNGKQLWSKAQTGLSSPVFTDLSGDGSGNVYLAGNVATAGGSRDAFTRKLSGSGSALWTKLFGTGAYDDARGVSTVTGGEVYVTGSTQGSLAHTNYGGSDGFLRKMDVNGNRVWTR